MRKRRVFTLAIVAALVSLWTGASLADDVERPNWGPPGSWRKIGHVEAKKSIDHDSIIVKGHDNFRKIKFRVKDAPLNIYKLVVTYDNGVPDNIEVRHRIPKNGESRAIDLRGVGTRSLRRIDFWYDTVGWNRGKADVYVYGQK